ncbi:stress-70 protein, mitochondrial, partial [Aphis craccivora]
TFDIDANGIVHVSARDKGTGREQQISIQSSGGLSKDEIENMVKNAEQYAQQDQIKKDRVEALNQADSIVNDTESKLTEYQVHIPEEDATNIRELIKEVREKITQAQADNDLDPENLKASTQKLQQASLKMFEVAYKKMAAKREENQNPSGDGQATEQESKKEHSM